MIVVSGQEIYVLFGAIDHGSDYILFSLLNSSKRRLARNNVNQMLLTLQFVDCA